jgi:hypothetical protein
MSVPRPLALSLALTITLLALAVPASAVIDLTMAGQLAYGVPHDVAVDGDYAYVAAQGAVSVFDVSTPANPVQVAIIDTPGSAEGVTVSGTYLYVADWDMGLRVYDISSPEAPAAAWSVDTPGYAYGVAVSGTYAYVADHAAGLRVIALSTESEVGSYDTSGYAWDVAVTGDYAYVSDGFAGLVILDVSTPASPSLAATCAATDSIKDVALQGNYAYAADGTAGLKVIDITTPAAPNCAYGALDTSGRSTGIFVDGEYAYLAEGTAGLLVVDITDPSAPTEIEGFDTAGQAVAVDVSNNAALVADDFGGLVVVDVSSRPSPTLVGQAPTAGNAEGIVAPDLTAYLADGSGGLVAFDISDPTDPSQLWSCPGGQAMDVDVLGDYAYVADWSAGLKVVDVSVPTGPVCGYGSVATGGNPNGVAVSGTRAYVAAGDAGLVACDISTPATPSVLWTSNTPGSANDTALSGNYAFVADGASGLVIIDVTSPTPAVTSVATSGHAWGAAYANAYVYLASGDAGLEVIDVSTPATASNVATLPLDGSAHSVSIYGDYAYVSAGGWGVSVVDIRDPLNPALVSSVATPSVPGPADLAVAAGYAYVADAESGLVVVDLLPPYTELARRQSPAYGERLTARELSDGSGVTYVASRSTGLQIVQVGEADDASDPSFVRTKQGLGDVTDLSVTTAGTYGYVTDRDGRLSVVNMTNATNPSLVGSATTSGSPLAVASTTIGGGSYALVADGDAGLSVISTQLASSPYEKTSFDTPGWCSDVVPATLDGDPVACVADGESGVRLINLSAIGTAAVTVFSDNFEEALSGWTVGGTVEWYTGSPRRGTHSVRLRNDGSIEGAISTVGYGRISASYYLAASLTTTAAAVTAEWYDGSSWNELERIENDDADETGTLREYTHELPALAEENPSFALRFSLTNSAAGDFGYVDDVVLISESASDPYEVGFYNTPGQARGVAVWGDYAYVADGDAGLRIVDISVQGSLSEVGSFDTTGYAAAVEGVGSIAVVADGGGGVVLLDCTSPTDPVEMASYDTPGWASDVSVLAGHAYVIDSGWGLTIFRLWHTFPDVLFNHWAFTEIEAAHANGVVFGYLDGRYRPTITCTRDQMAVFIARADAGGDASVPDPPAETQTFPDIPDGSPAEEEQHWAYKYIEYCYSAGIVTGYVEANGTFYRPLRTVRRDQMAVFMARALEGGACYFLREGDDGYDDCAVHYTWPTEATFPDVLTDYWAFPHIEYCVDAGIVQGYPDGVYRPWKAVSRDQMAVYVYRAFGLTLP